ncbi:MAG: bifunctional DNA-binding transcriptional regulator/O6-methylguanine-DNA methyltransferase Ada [bacterium]|nr:bifunctional DNA-binding transcriptional regulator/O6-methylguanine-DNA methyltransferase Ada [Candidatus Kapabacteria bacterium]
MITSAQKALKAHATLSDARWAAVIARDAKADGTFYFSVKTTGVYCRPSCGARKPLPENVSFYSTREDAEAAGFRPCKRCKPDQGELTELQAEKVIDACRYIEQSDSVPSLSEIAQHVGMSAYHFHRTFRRQTGLTPKQYATAHREARMRGELARTGSVTEAIYAAGYNSNARFYEKSSEILGMTASKYRDGGVGTAIMFAIGESSLGSVLVARSERGVCAILLGDDADILARDLQDRFPRATLIGGDAEFVELIATVIGFVEDPRIGLLLPLDIRGTAFQQRVWNALREIPVGSTASYTDVAAMIGSPKSVRAVAQACGANALAVAIPCHRVVRTDGGLSGYRWGVERKRELLNREGATLVHTDAQLFDSRDDE